MTTLIAMADVRVVEIESFRGPAFLKALVAPVFLAAAVAAFGTAKDASARLFLAILMLIAAVMLAMNVVLLVRRPLALRATAEGVWFGGGPVLPWTEVRLVHEHVVPMRWNAPTDALSRGITFELQHRRTMFRLPWRCWFSSGLSFDVTILTYHLPETPAALSAQLNGMRNAACGAADGVLPGVAQPAVARTDRH